MCQIAPRTFYAWVKRAPSKRALWDATITEVLAGFYEPDERRSAQTGVVVRVAEDVGPPAAGGHPGGQVHRGASDAPQPLAGRAPAEVGAHHDR